MDTNILSNLIFFDLFQYGEIVCEIAYKYKKW